MWPLLRTNITAKCVHGSHPGGAGCGRPGTVAAHGRSRRIFLSELQRYDHNVPCPTACCGCTWVFLQGLIRRNQGTVSAEVQDWTWMADPTAPVQTGEGGRSQCCLGVVPPHLTCVLQKYKAARSRQQLYSTQAPLAKGVCFMLSSRTARRDKNHSFANSAPAEKYFFPAGALFVSPCCVWYGADAIRLWPPACRESLDLRQFCLLW